MGLAARAVRAMHALLEAERCALRDGRLQDLPDLAVRKAGLADALRDALARAPGRVTSDIADLLPALNRSAQLMEAAGQGLSEARDFLRMLHGRGSEQRYYRADGARTAFHQGPAKMERTL